MEPTLLAIITLRGLGSLFALQGKSDVSQALYASAAAIEAGRNIDVAMQEVADKLKDDVDLGTWFDLHLQLTKETAEFLKP